MTSFLASMSRLGCSCAITLILLITLTPSSACAVDSHRALSQALHRKWQIQQGLPNPMVTRIIQTSDGVLWLGTQAGLYWFDGVRFESALHSPQSTLDGVWISDLCEGTDGTLWIATRSDGLLSLKDGNLTHQDPFSERVTPEHPLRPINALCRDEQGRIWIGADGGLAKLDDGKMSRFSTAHGLQIPNIKALATANDILWIGGDGAGLTKYDGLEFTPVSSESRGTVQSLIARPDGTVWAGSTTGLHHLKPEGDVHYTTATGLVDDNVECLILTNEGDLWIGTRTGLSRMTKNGFESVTIHEGLTQSTVLSLCEDHERSVWVGTKHGLNQFTDRITLPITTAEGLPDNNTGPIVEDSQGRLWIGTLQAGLAQYDGRRCMLAFSTQNGLPSNRIVALSAGAPDELWIGTNMGLTHVEQKHLTMTYTTAHGLPSDSIQCLVRDNSGVLWAGTKKGLARFENGHFEPARSPELAMQPIQAMTTDGQSGLVVATPEGVYRLINDEFTRVPDKTLPLKDVNTLWIGPDGELWIALRGRGLALFDTSGVLHKFTVADGLYDEDISGFALDELDRLWMACSRGVFQINRGDLLAFAAGDLTWLKCSSFSPMDSMRMVECQRGVSPVLCETRDGKFWFSTIHGAIVIPPEKMDRQLPSPTVAVSEVQINGRSVLPDQMFELSPGLNNLSFKYTARTYALPSATTFRYQLQGFDPNWVLAETRRQAFYTNLPPGKYRFQVEASNPGQSWTPMSYPIQIIVHPRFWQTAWFGASCALGLLFVIWLMHGIRMMRVRTHMNAVVSERSRIARELHDTLIQGFSGVTMQIQAVASQLHNEDARASLEDVIADASACLREARQSVSGLRNSQGSSMGLPAAIAASVTQLTETSSTRVNLNLPQRITPLNTETEFNLLRIAQEAITNATRHAHARSIDVSLTHSSGNLILEIRDDGAGFSVSETERHLQGHYGLIGMRERARQIAAELSIDSQPGSGTVVRAVLPVR